MPSDYKKLIDYDTKQISLSISDTEQGDLTTVINSSTGNRIISLNKNIQLQVPQDDPSHLTYFAFIKTYPSNGTIPRLSPHSMVVVEKVIEEGLPVDQAAIFRDPENLIWAGPVHQHPEQGWMEGAYHISASHRPLRRIGINNFKVQDVRILEDIGRYNIELGKIINNRSEVSDAYVSRGVDNGASLMFTFDHLSYMTENSKYGRLFADSSTEVQNELLRRSRITELSIMRSRVVPRDGVNEIGSATKSLFDFSIQNPPEVLVTSADNNGVLEAQSRYVVDGEDFNKFINISLGQEIPSDYKFYGSVQEIGLEKVGRKRTILVKDGSVSRISDGQYQYSAKIQVEDGSFSFLKEKLKEFSDMIHLMNGYLTNAEDRKNYNKSSGKFNKSFINSQKVGEGAVPAWLASIVSFVEVLDLLTTISQQEKTRTARALYVLVSPEYGSISSVRAYVNSLQAFEKRFQEAIGKSKSAHARDKSSIAHSSARSFISDEFKFSYIFDTNTAHNTGFDYLNLGQEFSITSQQLKDRIQIELLRYNNELYSAEELRQEFDFISSNDARALTSATTQYSYIAPASFRVNSTIVDLLSTNKDPLDFSSVTAVIQSILDNPANRGADVNISRDVLGLLRKAGTGPTTERVESLANVFLSAARDEGIYIEDALEGSILKVDPVSPTQSRTRSSEGYLGSDNKFSSDTQETPANTTRSQSPSATSGLSVLQDLLRYKNPPSDEDTPQTVSLEQISFDLTRNDNFINKRVRTTLQSSAGPASSGQITQALQNLPTQIKLLTRNKERVYRSRSAALSTDNDAETDAFIYNFSMIRVIEYLAGYEDGDAQRPIWRVISSNILDSARKGLLCRIRRYVDVNTNIGAFEELNRFPVYNEYFVVSGGDLLPPGYGPQRSTRQITYSALDIGFQATSFTQGVEGSIARRLITFENQTAAVGGETEYISSSITGAPTSSRRRLSGIVSAPEAPPAAPPAQTAATPRARNRTATTRTTGGGSAY